MFRWLFGVFARLYLRIARRFSIDFSLYDPARLSYRARKLLYRTAGKEARRLHHEYIGTEHMLLGLIKERTGLAMNVLDNLSVDRRKIAREVAGLIVEGPSEVTTTRYSPSIMSVLKHAADEARILNHKYVGSEHLLLGLLQEQAGVAAKVLTDCGLTVERIRAEIVKLLCRGQAAAPDHGSITGKGD